MTSNGQYIVIFHMARANSTGMQHRTRLKWQVENWLKEGPKGATHADRADDLGLKIGFNKKV